MYKTDANISTNSHNNVYTDNLSIQDYNNLKNTYNNNINVVYRNQTQDILYQNISNQSSTNINKNMLMSETDYMLQSNNDLITQELTPQQLANQLDLVIVRHGFDYTKTIRGTQDFKTVSEVLKPNKAFYYKPTILTLKTDKQMYEINNNELYTQNINEEQTNDLYIGGLKYMLYMITTRKNSKEAISCIRNEFIKRLYTN